MGPDRKFDAGVTGCLDGEDESPSDSTITWLIPLAKGIVKRQW